MVVAVEVLAVAVVVVAPEAEEVSVAAGVVEADSAEARR